MNRLAFCRQAYALQHIFGCINQPFPIDKMVKEDTWKTTAQKRHVYITPSRWGFVDNLVHGTGKEGLALQGRMRDC